VDESDKQIEKICKSHPDTKSDRIRSRDQFIPRRTTRSATHTRNHIPRPDPAAHGPPNPQSKAISTPLTATHRVRAQLTWWSARGACVLLTAVRTPDRSRIFSRATPRAGHRGAFTGKTLLAIPPHHTLENNPHKPGPG
jgi:hypothetical protein